MSKLFNRVKFSIPSTPGTDTVTVGSRSDNSFFLPAEQGAVDGDEVYYVIQKSNKDVEVGIGTIATNQTQVTRDTVLSSIVSGVAGTDKINIDSSAFMAFVTPAEALQSLRTVRTITSTSDTLVDKDGMGQVTYNSASAVAVALAQANTSLKFLPGWLCFVRNIGAGAVTITPTTSTINSASTLVLNQGDSAMIVSDGTNYTAIVWAVEVAKPAFSAHKDGTDQTGVVSATETQITFSTEEFDTGGYFASNAWTPPAGLVSFQGGLLTVGSFAAGALTRIVLYKNGVAFKETTAPTAGTTLGFVSGSFQDRANGTDTYKLYGFQNGATGTVTFNGNAKDTFFSGAWLSP